ncbi:MAG: hypothetical protein ACMVO3_22895 [Thalassobaculum sp.]
MIAGNPTSGPELRRDVALATLLEIRAILGGQIAVEMPEPWRTQVCGSVLWALACHSDPVVSRAAQRVRRDFRFPRRRPGRRLWFSVPVLIGPDGAPAPGGAA